MEAKCSCGTADEAAVWCHIHGYKSTPPAIRRTAEIPKPDKRHRTRRECVRCGKPFLAKRSDAKFCSGKCRKRASRYPDAGLTVTDNQKSCLQPLEN
jgi:ribosomal protein S27AE